MADVKISGLPASTTPLAGTEVLPIVQGGVTKQVSVNNLTTGKSVSATSFVPSGATIPTNGVYLPAANSVGIATNSTERVLVNSTGDVGIGVSSPTAPLHVFKGNGSTTAINTALIVNFESPTASLAGSGTAIEFRGKSGGGNIANYSQAQIATNTNGSNNAHGLSFYYKPGAGSSLTEGFQLDQLGNVMVGTTTPIGAFTVNGSMALNGTQASPNYFYGGSGDNVSFFLKSGVTAGLFSQIEVTGNWNGSSVTGGKIAFSAGGTEAMRIFPSTGVSIGNTTDPGAGNLRFTTAGTNGIYFGSSSRLDDYQEGTYTPVVTAAAGTITSYTSTGKYVKTGKMVMAEFNVAVTDNGTGSVALIVTLPFAASSGVSYVGAGRENALTGNMLQALCIDTTATVWTYSSLYPAGTGSNCIVTVTYSV